MKHKFLFSMFAIIGAMTSPLASALDWESALTKAGQIGIEAWVNHHKGSSAAENKSGQIVGGVVAEIPGSIRGPKGATKFSACRQLFHNGIAPHVAAPVDLKLRELCFEDFAVLHSGSLKTGYFCAERIDYSQKREKQKRTDRFYAEARLPFSERAQLDDYSGSGVDRGHLCAARFRTTPEAMAQSFSLANIFPQSSANNQGVWRDAVEGAVAKWGARSRAPIYVVTGVFLSPSNPINPKIGSVTPPPAFYKVAFSPSENKKVVFWSYNQNVRKPSFMSYEELVAKTGIDFFPS